MLTDEKIKEIWGKTKPTPMQVEFARAIERAARMIALMDAAKAMCADCWRGMGVRFGKPIPDAKDEVYHGEGLASWPCRSERLWKMAKEAP